VAVPLAAFADSTLDSIVDLIHIIVCSQVHSGCLLVGYTALPYGTFPRFRMPVAACAPALVSASATTGASLQTYVPHPY